MKKNLVRVVALLLVAMLALTLLPLGALAATEYVGVDKNVYDEYEPELIDQIGWLGTDKYPDGGKIKVDDYDALIEDEEGNLYDFRGFASTESFQKKMSKIYTDSKLTPDQKDKAFRKLIKETELSFSKKDMKIDKFPTSGDPEKVQKWYQKWGWVIAGYTPHQHKLSYWYSDGTTHWRECLTCGENFMYQNWCQDGDEDRICNVCGGDVPYHDVTVVETEGGKITVNKDLASHRTKITADVDVADGYRLKALHFTKIRDDGTRQEITRRKVNGQFWTYMPTYELEVSAEFIKN